MRKLLFGVLFFSTALSAQNTPRFSQFNFAQGVNNPSAIAIDGSIMADLIFRNQWFGIDGAPVGGAFNAQYEINQSMAVGLTSSYDRIGVMQNAAFALQYAYRLQFDGNRSLGFGIGLGLDNAVNSLAGSSLTTSNDPAFSTSYARTFFNGSFGIFYNAPRFYIGASIPQLFQNTALGPERGFQPPRWHYYVSAGYYLEAGENYTFNPHIQLKATMNAPLQADLILRNTFFNRFSIVAGYRSENSLIAGVDVLIAGHARIGYSFNYSLGALSRVKGASNELYLGFAFPYHNDRYDFDRRRYIKNKGTNKFDIKRDSKRKHYHRGRQYGRKDRFR